MSTDTNFAERCARNTFVKESNPFIRRCPPAPPPPRRAARNELALPRWSSTPRKATEGNGYRKAGGGASRQFSPGWKEAEGLSSPPPAQAHTVPAVLDGACPHRGHAGGWPSSAAPLLLRHLSSSGLRWTWQRLEGTCAVSPISGDGWSGQDPHQDPRHSSGTFLHLWT